MRKIKNRLVFISSLFFTLVTYSGVNIKTGEFYISYTDIEPEHTLGSITNIYRTYSSKSTFNGLFGSGWSSALDTFLSVYPDGSIIVYENGIYPTYFESILTTDDLINNMIDQLIKSGIEQGFIVNNPDEILKNREKLKEQKYRTSRWGEYIKKGYLKYTPEFSVGMEWEHNQESNQKIIKTQTGYVRTYENQQDYFNFKGQLIKSISGDSFSEFEYVDGKLAKITNADHASYLITTNKDGHIVKIAFGNEFAVYKYDNDNLVETEDAEKNNYKHTYDANYNMIRISYTDGTSMEITYSRENYLATQVNYKGEITDYDYKFFYNNDGSEDKKHYATAIVKTDKKGEKQKSYYEYLLKENENGEEYISKYIKEEKGIKSVFIMDDLCYYPIEKNVDNQITKLKYDSRCLLVEEIAPSGKVKTQKWHSDVDKITEVNDAGLITTFEYDKDFNMVLAKRSDNKMVKLEYDKDQKVVAINMGKQLLSIDYKTDGQPSTFNIQNLGKTNVSFDDEGMLKSDTENKAASEVMAVFQEMMNFIKPAETNLNPEY
ncbi:YD repeat-containing protein [Flavobacterium fluvii]|uniref:YD repeat-containing protein n=1 Tax=Flavobacterium fluvii TaxID=468056 RepID=A0A1M5HXM8_9FLAO|nr:DUF6531 domain-containing protein [Flavobacterium fluvii]SHG20718.1 YD repeat-containing protein [Flavobacterium fluvii]